MYPHVTFGYRKSFIAENLCQLSATMELFKKNETGWETPTQTEQAVNALRRGFLLIKLNHSFSIRYCVL